jgi:hypothetical protein
VSIHHTLHGCELLGRQVLLRAPPSCERLSDSMAHAQQGGWRASAVPAICDACTAAAYGWRR